MSRNRSIRLAAAVALAAAFAPPAAPAATISVDRVDTDDVNDAFCSLAEAIVAANLDTPYHGCTGGSGVDVVEFDLPPGSTILGGSVALPTVTSSLVVAGPGAGELTIDGADLQPLFLVDSGSGGAALEITDVTLTGGNAFTFAFNRGGAATVAAGDVGVFRRVVFRDNFSELAGGALLLLGETGAPANGTVEDCHFDANEGGLVGGGAITAARSILAVSRSTFTLNSTLAEPASGQARGGGALLAIDSTTTVRTSTFVSNATRGSGGGILVASAESAIPDLFVMTDSTVIGNLGDTDGDDVGNIGGLAMSALPGDPFAVELQNNLIAGNQDAGATHLPDVFIGGAGITSLGFNLIATNPSMAAWFPTGNPNANGDYVGTLAAPLLPAMSPVGPFGGPTPVSLPLAGPGSLVIDRGKCAFPGADQRGYVDAATGSRPVDDPFNPTPAGGDHCDIGAAESGAVPPPDLPFLDGFEDGTTSRWSSWTL
jgi:hypothetical protein